MSDKPTVLVIRNPDYENEFVVEGDVDTIDIDLGRGFNGPKDFANLDAADQVDYLDSWRDQVKHLDRNGPIRQAVERLIAEMADEKQLIAQMRIR
jgi:hypothetical protein